MEKRRILEGFGPTKSDNMGMANGLKKLGELIGNKSVRPVGGNAKGVTSVDRGTVGDVKMKPIGGKSVASPSTTSINIKQDVKLTTHDAMKTGLPKKDVRPQPNCS